CLPCGVHLQGTGFDDQQISHNLLHVKKEKLTMKLRPILPHSGRLFAGGLLLLSAFSLRADYQSTVLTQGPVAYWRLNETVAPPVPPILALNAGSVGAAGNGTYTNGVIRGVAGAIAGDANTAVRFPQTAGNRVRIPYQPQW